MHDHVLLRENERISAMVEKKEPDDFVRHSMSHATWSGPRCRTAKVEGATLILGRCVRAEAETFVHDAVDRRAYKFASQHREKYMQHTLNMLGNMEMEQQDDNALMIF
jgi:hypothetical protein